MFFTRSFHCLLAVLCLTAPSLAQPSPETNGEATGSPRSIHIQGRDYTPYDPEVLEGYGLRVPEIPDERNAALVYLEAINAAVDPPNELAASMEEALDGQWPEGEAGEKLADWLRQNKASLDAARRASEMDAYYMPLFRGDGDSLLSALLPQLRPQRQLAKTLSLEAVYLTSQGNADAALANCLAAQRMAAQVANGSTIIEGLVGYAISAVADNQMMIIAESGKADSELLKAASMEMGRIAESFPTFERLMEYERMFSASLVDDIMDKPSFGADEGMYLPPVMVPVLATKNSAPCWQRFASCMKRLYLPDRAVRRHIEDHYDTLINATRREDGGVGLTVDEGELFKRIPSWDLASKLLLPSLSRLYDVSLRHESNLVRTQLTLATEAYRQETGEPPASLVSLVPAYVENLPADPMTGYEFEYQPAPASSSGSAGGDGAGAKGIELITRDNEAEYLAKRKAPAILNPRAAKWRRYTEAFCERHGFTDVQRAGARSVLREMEARAVKYEQVHGAKLQALVAAADKEELDRRVGPLEEMFGELRDRLATIPTAAQKAAAAEKAEQSKRSK